VAPEVQAPTPAAGRTTLQAACAKLADGGATEINLFGAKIGDDGARALGAALGRYGATTSALR
jgi:hypothetical protein